jgi:hypothetical protein
MNRISDWAMSSWRNFLVYTLIVFFVSMLFGMVLSIFTGAEC